MSLKKAKSKYRNMALLKKVLGKDKNRRLVARRLFSETLRLSKEEKVFFAREAAKNRTIQKSLNLSSDVRDQYIFDDIVYQFDISIVLEIFGYFVNENAEFFNRFDRLRIDLENYFIKGEYAGCIETLNEIDEWIGVSIWTLDAKMAVYNRFDKSKELKAFQESLSKSDISQIASVLFRKYVSSSISVFYSQFLMNVLKEYRGAGKDDYANLISLLSVSDGLDDSIDVIKVVPLSQRLNPIDRLYLYKKITKIVLCNQEYIDSKEFFCDFLSNVSPILQDASWKNMELFHNDRVNYRVSDDFLEILLSYSKGNYVDVIEKSKIYSDKYPRDLSVADVIAKSMVFLDDYSYLESVIKPEISIHFMLVGMLAGLHMRFDSFDIISDQYMTLYYKYNCFDFMLSAMPMLAMAFPFKRDSNIVSFCENLYCSDLPISPRYTSRIKYEEGRLNSIYLGFLGDRISYDSALSRSRQIRNEIQYNLNDQDANRAKLNKLLDDLEKESDILQSEFKYVWCSSKIATGDWQELIDRLAISYVNDNSRHVLYPVEAVANEILSKDIYKCNVSSVICFYIYVTVYNKQDRIVASEVLEDYLNSCGVNYPSELMEKLDSLDDLHAFFFEYVCSQETMGDLIYVETYKLLLLERFKIIYLLNKKYSYKSLSLINEEKKIIDFFLYGNIAHEHKSNKIYIDSDGVRRSSFSEYIGYYKQFVELGDFKDSSLMDLFEQEDQTGVSRLDNAKYYFYGALYQKLVDDFILNEDCGLVRYLSSEIRHGVMPNQLRSVFEAHKLVTSLTSNQKYESNVFWRDFYTDILGENLLYQVDEHLNWFSGEVDRLIDKANKWPTVTLDSKDRQVAFNFSFSRRKLEAFVEFVHGKESPEDFFDACLEYIWFRVDDGLKLMRSLLNRELKRDFIKAFDDLSTRLRSIPVPLSALVVNVRKAKNEIIEEISAIETWFQRPSSNSKEEYKVCHVLEKSVDCVNSIFEPRVIFKKLDIDEVGENLYINHAQMLGLTRGLVTAYQNCISHGDCSDGFHFSMKGEVVDGFIEVEVKNLVSAEKIEIIENDGILEKVRSYSKGGLNELLTKEGGTGLYKTYRYLTDAIDGAEFEVAIENGYFFQKIKFGGFICH